MLYDIVAGNLPLATDVQQIVNFLKGKHDLGTIPLPAPVTDPTTAPTLTASTGSALGIGAYQYVVTYITGIVKTDGTLLITGETLVSPTASITTTTGQQQMSLSNIPVSASPATIGRRIYRTKVGGSTFYLLYTMLDNVTTTYADQTPDASFSTPNIPVANTTGTNINFQNGVIITNTLDPTKAIVFPDSSAINFDKYGNIVCPSTIVDSAYWHITDKQGRYLLTMQLGNTAADTVFWVWNGKRFAFMVDNNRIMDVFVNGLNAGIELSSYAVWQYNGTTVTFEAKNQSGGYMPILASAYNTSSDERLKENIRDTSHSLADLLQVKVRDFEWKADGKTTTGFIAQELHEVFPESVKTGGDDEKTAPWSVDYGSMTPYLVKAVQELSAKVDSLEARLAAAEAKLP